MSGKRSRTKGHNWEREIARMLRPIFGDDVRRGLQYQDGANAPDVIVPCFHIEAKVGARPPIVRALEQAERDAAPGKWPVAICKQDRQEPTVTMRLDDFLELVGAWWAETQPVTQNVTRYAFGNETVTGANAERDREGSWPGHD